MIGIEGTLAVIGGIMCGVAYARADKNTKWASNLGLVAIMGLTLMVIGMTASIYKVRDMEPLGVHRVVSSSGYGVSIGTISMHYGYCMKHNGHYGWGMCYGPK